MCGQQKSEDPNSSPMADSAITRGGIHGLGSSLYSVDLPVFLGPETEMCGTVVLKLSGLYLSLSSPPSIVRAPFIEGYITW